jgi:hypothetical protein
MISKDQFQRELLAIVHRGNVPTLLHSTGCIDLYEGNVDRAYEQYKRLKNAKLVETPASEAEL